MFPSPHHVAHHQPSPNPPSLHQDVFEDNENIHMVMELCTGGSILERLETVQYTEKRIATIIRSILRFIAQCHAKGIIYRDVKPDNFLFVSNDPDSAVKATDFGLSIRYDGDGGWSALQWCVEMCCSGVL